LIQSISRIEKDKLFGGVLLQTLISILIFGCGDSEPTVNNSSQYIAPSSTQLSTTSESNETSSEADLNWTILFPTNPPFIDMSDCNLGEIDDFTYDEDVEITFTPIPQPPVIQIN
jgi:hypothetical protein